MCDGASINNIRKRKDNEVLLTKIKRIKGGLYACKTQDQDNLLVSHRRERITATYPSSLAAQTPETAAFTRQKKNTVQAN